MHKCAHIHSAVLAVCADARTRNIKPAYGTSTTIQRKQLAERLFKCRTLSNVGVYLHHVPPTWLQLADRPAYLEYLVPAGPPWCCLAVWLRWPAG